MGEAADKTLFGDTLRTYLTGEWRVERTITDLKGPNGAFAGFGHFEAAGVDTLAYREAGTLTLPDAAMKAERRYRWHMTAALTAEVYFDDGRFFHSIQVQGGQAQTRHSCAPDTYNVAYAFTSEDRWTQQWRVTGPRKDYLSDSVFIRAV